MRMMKYDGKMGVPNTTNIHIYVLAMYMLTAECTCTGYIIC